MTELEMLAASWKECNMTAATLDRGKWGCIVQTKRQIGDGKPAYSWSSPVYQVFDWEGVRRFVSMDYRAACRMMASLKRMKRDEENETL